MHLTGFPVSSFNNVVHPSVEIGSKTTVSLSHSHYSAACCAIRCLRQNAKRRRRGYWCAVALSVAGARVRVQVGAQCLLGEGVRLGDKCSVKRSVLGKNCRIGANVKVRIQGFWGSGALALARVAENYFAA